MHWAAMNGKLNMVKLLHSEGASLLSKNVVETTPLSDAAGYGHTDVVRYMVEQVGAEALFDKNIYQLDAYNRAAYLARPETLEFIIEATKTLPDAQNRLNEIAGEGFSTRDMAESGLLKASSIAGSERVREDFRKAIEVLQQHGVTHSQGWENTPNEQKPDVKTIDYAGRWKQFLNKREAGIAR